jgi:hypothetical protein
LLGKCPHRILANDARIPRVRKDEIIDEQVHQAVDIAIIEQGWPSINDGSNL